MSRRYAHLVLLALGIAPIVVVSAQPTAQEPTPTCEQVFKNIKVFKGVPANDLIPAMEFMAASLKFQCTDCHDPKDYAADNRTKETARNMVLMQRDINAKHFNGRNEITCHSCHGGKEHPAGTPLPAGISLRHERMEAAPKPEDLLAKHIAAVGKVPPVLVRKGTLTAANNETHKPETTPLELVQADGGKFRLTSPAHKASSDGKQVWYGGFPVTDEAAAIFGRMGRAWRGESAFDGLERLTVTGKDTVGKASVVVVRGSRPATLSTEELSFDAKTGLLVRMVNVRRSSLGSVVTAFDYTNYKKVGGAMAPMKVVATFADGEAWWMDFKSATVQDRVNEAEFGGG
ncbi:MAG: photosynthetic reaction center cytochrome c subunit [Fimbriimonadaceae bacterium]|nr:photosynthetic reaction center cytochrome c subunit [Fimbriimonadaceae bacterium]